MSSMRQLINLMEGTASVPSISRDLDDEVNEGKYPEYEKDYFTANQPSKTRQNAEIAKAPREQTPWSRDPIAAATDRVYDRMSNMFSKKKQPTDENISIDDLFDTDYDTYDDTCDDTCDDIALDDTCDNDIICDIDNDIDEGLFDGYTTQDIASDDYFPNGADSPVVRNVGPSGARQGDNPEQKKMQVAEVHKELVYGYREYLKETQAQK